MPLNRRAVLCFGAASFAALATPSRRVWAKSALPRLIWVSPTASSQGGPFFEELRHGLRELGYAEGSNIQIEPAWGDGTSQGAARVISRAVAAAPQVIVTQGSMGPLAIKATSAIPIVFGYSGDPVAAGLVDSLPRPGRNATGISYLSLELVGKRMEILKELLPEARRIAVVASPAHPGDPAERDASLRAAGRLGITLDYFEIGRGGNVANILDAIERSQSDAVMFFPTQTVIANRAVIAEWSLKHRIPTISGWAQFAEGGNILSYGPNLAEASRRLAYYVVRILKGAKPADLPVELPNRVEYVINQRTAKAIGVAVSPSMLLRADRVLD